MLGYLLSMLANIYCWVIGHKYKVVQHFGHDARRVVCKRCSGDWAMKDSVSAFVPWDGTFAELYADMGYTIKPVNACDPPLQTERK